MKSAGEVAPRGDCAPGLGDWGQIAHEQGISYDTVKRQRRKLLGQVRNSFFSCPVLERAVNK
jgi:hypothetical protein